MSLRVRVAISVARPRVHALAVVNFRRRHQQGRRRVLCRRSEHPGDRTERNHPNDDRVPGATDPLQSAALRVRDLHPGRMLKCSVRHGICQESVFSFTRNLTELFRALLTPSGLHDQQFRTLIREKCVSEHPAVLK